MTDQLVESPKITVGFERAVQVRDYEKAVASIFIQVPTTPEDLVGDHEQVLKNLEAKVKPTFAVAKATVFEQLGISFEVDPTELVVRELLEKHLAAVELTPQQAQAVEEAAATAQASSANRPPQTVTQGNGGKGTPAPSTKQGLWEELAAEPKKWFDNRQSKKSPSGPDFKRKYSGEGLWLEYKGQNNVPEGVVLPEPSAF